MKEAYAKAIAEWQRLVSKYPGTEEASVALYRIGLIHEEKLGDLTRHWRLSQAHVGQQGRQRPRRWR